MDEAGLQEHILGKIELALDGRSWNWLAGQSKVPQSTLATQKAGPRFTIEVLWAVGKALHRPFAFFLPGEGRDAGDPAATEAFFQMAAIVDRARAVIPDADARVADVQEVVPQLPPPRRSASGPQASRSRRGKPGL